MDPRYQSSWYFVIRQFGWAVLALLVMMASQEDQLPEAQEPGAWPSAPSASSWCCSWRRTFFGCGHHRWLRLGNGPVGVQPSELAKPALVVFLAFFVTWRGRAINNGRYTPASGGPGRRLVIFGVVVADLGTAVVLG